MAELRYDIARGVLTGELSPKLKIHIVGVVSGGRGGAVSKVYAKDKYGNNQLDNNKKPIVIKKIDNYGVQDKCLINNPRFTDRKHINDEDKIGGPIPEGNYIMIPKFVEAEGKVKYDDKKNPKVGVENWIRLLPLANNKIVNSINGRDGLAIHGKGIQGSVGCIVVPSGGGFGQLQALFKHLVQLSTEYKEDYAKYPHLKVEAGINYVTWIKDDRATCLPKDKLSTLQPSKLL